MMPRGYRVGELDVQPHGTLAAARRHYRRDGPGWRCRPCRQAEARRWQDYAASRRAS